jgi:hypothetical protein
MDIADLHRERPVEVGLRRAQAVDARHRGDHDDVAAGQQGHRGGVSQPLDIGVDRGVLLDVGVGLRDVRLGLVVVVVGDEVLDRVVRQQFSQFVGELGSQRLVRCHDQGRSLQALDQPGRARRLPGPGRPEEHDVSLTAGDPLFQLFDGLRLVAGRPVLADHLEPSRDARNVSHRPVFGDGEDRMFGRKCHGPRLRGPTDSGGFVGLPTVFDSSACRRCSTRRPADGVRLVGPPTAVDRPTAAAW